MYHYEFYGIVHPERFNVNVKNLPSAKVRNEELGIFGEVRFECVNSNAKITFLTESNYPNEFLPTVRNIVCEYGRFVIDSYCYIRSLNYELEITGVRCKENGLDKKFSIQLETDLERDMSRINSRLNEIISLISLDSKLFFLGDVFADFRRAIKYVKMSGGFFYRAIETIRSAYFDEYSIKDDMKRVKDGWNGMNHALGLKQSDYDDLLKFSKRNRHGSYPSFTAEQRLKLAKDARHIIDLFINYIKTEIERRGNG